MAAGEVLLVHLGLALDELYVANDDRLVRANERADLGTRAVDRLGTLRCSIRPCRGHVLV